MFNRKYDYKRAKCEDLVLIRNWFCLVHNIMAKYGILDDDVHNFNEAGYQMGVIATSRVISSESRNRPKSTRSRIGTEGMAGSREGRVAGTIITHRSGL